MSEFWTDFLIVIARCVFSVAFVMNIVPLLIWGERKGAAYIQDRPGPNRAPIDLPNPLDVPRLLAAVMAGQPLVYKPIVSLRAAGLIHTLTDVVKLAFKEDITPDHVEKFYWFIAPVIAMTISLCTFAVVPFGDQLLGVQLKVSDLDGGLLFVLALTSLGVYGIMLAGWSSNNKFSLLGGLRASAQMVSYELSMGLAAVVVFLMAGSVSLTTIVEMQQHPLDLGFVSIPAMNWTALSPFGFLAFLLFWVSAFAETNRTPFDLPEGEAELVGGYHTEYSSFRFALFFMAEYANMIVASAVTATLFFGGYAVPLLDGPTIRAHADVILAVLGFGAVPAFVTFAVIAFRRQGRPFYQVLAADDPRRNEPKFWTGLWLGAAGAHAGLGVLGLMGGLTALSTWAAIPELGGDLVAAVLHVSSLGAKVLIGCWIMIWVRWTVPRMRYDQLMNLGWKYMLPVALCNVFLAAGWIILRHELFA
ncbi:MAG: NADH-quinone oxidoreductase subunit H [Myxococcales bacterium]|nr:NADH-quinone oxidoreductase subunit H [Myxococcales bacterium]